MSEIPSRDKKVPKPIEPNPRGVMQRRTSSTGKIKKVTNASTIQAKAAAVKAVSAIQKTGRTHLENQERAYIAASRRNDRSLEARVASANQASTIHQQRTGKTLRITEDIVRNEEMYEEEEDEMPRRLRTLAPHLTTSNSEFNCKVDAYLSNKLVLSQMVEKTHRNWEKAEDVHRQFAEAFPVLKDRFLGHTQPVNQVQDMLARHKGGPLSPSGDAMMGSMTASVTGSMSDSSGEAPTPTSSDSNQTPRLQPGDLAKNRIQSDPGMGANPGLNMMVSQRSASVTTPSPSIANSQMSPLMTQQPAFRPVNYEQPGRGISPKGVRRASQMSSPLEPVQEMGEHGLPTSPLLFQGSRFNAFGETGRRATQPSIMGTFYTGGDSSASNSSVTDPSPSPSQFGLPPQQSAFTSKLPGDAQMLMGFGIGSPSDPLPDEFGSMDSSIWDSFYSEFNNTQPMTAQANFSGFDMNLANATATATAAAFNEEPAWDKFLNVNEMANDATDLAPETTTESEMGIAGDINSGQDLYSGY